ncbi:MAG: hypothetical protein QXP17_00725 [Candidatus Jordarchaeales archaeon]
MKAKKVVAATLTLLVSLFMIQVLLSVSVFPLFPNLQSDNTRLVAPTLIGKSPVSAEVTLSAYWINFSSFSTSKPVTLMLEENLYGNEYLSVNCSASSNQSVAMSFNISSVGGLKVNFTGVSLYLWRDGEGEAVGLVVQLRNATLRDGLPVPNVTLIEKSYSSTMVPSSPGWVTFLNESPVTLNVSDTCDGIFFIVVYANTTSETHFGWNVTADSYGDAGFAFVNNFMSFDDLNDVSKWELVNYDCWMNISLMVYDGFKFNLPPGWDLDYLCLDICEGVTLGSASGILDMLNGSFSVDVPGNRVYSASFSLSNIKPGLVWTTLEDRMNSGGYARINGSMGEAQMFLLRKAVNRISISVPLANFGMNVNLTAELRNATLDGNRWVPGTIIESIDVPPSLISSNYSWVTLNFTSSLSAGAYFLVLHVKDWLPSTNGGYYDWGSHMEGTNEGVPEFGYEIWTTDGGASWVLDARDPYGNRYWHCMKIAPDYTSWRALNDLLLLVNGTPVRNDLSWNSSLWLAPVNGSVTISVTAITQLNYSVSYIVHYVNYTGNLSGYTLYLNGTKLTSMIGNGYTKSFTTDEISYDKSEGEVSFLVELKDTSGWVEKSLIVFAFAKLSLKDVALFDTSKILYNYTHNGSTIFPEQSFIKLDYPAKYAVKNVVLNSSPSEDWLDFSLNETTRSLLVLKGENIPLLADGSKLDLEISLLPELSVTHDFSHVGRELAIVVGNFLDNPETVIATIVLPNGSKRDFQAAPSGNFTFTFNFTPTDAGKYILRIVSYDGTIHHERRFSPTGETTYIFRVYKLTAAIIQPNEKLTLGKTHTIKVWVGYSPPSSPKNFSGDISIIVNGTTLLEPQKSEEENVYVAYITPTYTGVLNITIKATDDYGENVTFSLLLEVVPPEGVNIYALSPPILQAILRHYELNQSCTQLSTMLLLTTIILTILFYLKPEFVEKYLKYIRHAGKS